MTGRHLLGAAGAALIAGVAAYRLESLHPVTGAMACAALAGCGVLAYRSRREGRVGLLLCLTAVAWLAGGLFPALVLAHRVPLVAALVSFPSGRLRRGVGWVAVAGAAVPVVFPVMARNNAAMLAMAVLVIAAAADAALHTGGPSRRAAALGVGAAVAYGGALALAALSRLAGWDVTDQLVVIYDLTVAVIALVLLAGLLAGRWVEVTIADLVVDLGDISGSGTLRERLAAAVGDPLLALGYWDEEQGRYVDDAGQVVELPSPGAGRAATEIDDGGRRSAVLVHDVVAGDPRLVTSVVAAVRIAVANARMQAEVRDRVAQLTASRRRIVEAADAERRRIARELQGGVEPRLDLAAELLAGVSAGSHDGDVLDVARMLQDAREELSDFAAGVRPAALTEGGLAAAIPVLVRRSPVPVEVSVSPDRLPPTVEGAIYFACSEALTNIAKHAAATRAAIKIAVAGGAVTARVTDDGRGGATAADGSGLHGLVDRMEALGGGLRLDSPAGAGTRIEMMLPFTPGAQGDEPRRPAVVAAGGGVAPWREGGR